MRITINGEWLEIDGERVGVLISHLPPETRMKIDDVLKELEHVIVDNSGLEDEVEDLRNSRTAAYSRGYANGWNDRDGGEEWNDEEP